VAFSFWDIYLHKDLLVQIIQICVCVCRAQFEVPRHRWKLLKFVQLFTSFQTLFLLQFLTEDNT